MAQVLQNINNFLHSDLVASILLFIVILAVTAIVDYVASRFMRGILHVNEERDLPSSSIFVNIVRGIVWFLGICIALSTCFNIDVSAALTALGIGGIAVSLGFQDTLSNLIGGLQVSLMRIIVPGDNIEVGSTSGVVTDVTWRHTCIHTSAGEDVIVPNSVINTTSLKHLPPVTRVKLSIVVADSGDNLDAVAKAIEATAAEAAGRVATLTKQPSVSFSAIDAEGFKGLLIFEVEDAGTADAAGDAALRAIAPLTRPDAHERLSQDAEAAPETEEQTA